MLVWLKDTILWKKAECINIPMPGKEETQSGFTKKWKGGTIFINVEKTFDSVWHIKIKADERQLTWGNSQAGVIFPK